VARRSGGICRGVKDEKGMAGVRSGGGC
jgi:hypothetical protein